MSRWQTFLLLCLITISYAHPLARPSVDGNSLQKEVHYAPYYAPYRMNQPYYPGRQEPYNQRYYGQPYYGQPRYSQSPPQACEGSAPHSMLARLESALEIVDQTHQGLEQVLGRLRGRPFSLFQFPRMVLETARTAASMMRELHQALGVVNEPTCMTRFNAEINDDSNSSGDSTSDGSNSDNRSSTKARIVASFMELRQSAKSLESAIKELFESPFKAFTNINEVFTDLSDSLHSAVEAVIGENEDSDQGDTSTADSGFGGFETTADSSTADAFSAFSAGAAAASGTGSVTPSFTTSASVAATPPAPGGWTRRFTFTAEDMLTFTNERVFTLGQETFTRMFTFTTADVYQFTDTTIVEDNQLIATEGGDNRYEAAKASATREHDLASPAPVQTSSPTPNENSRRHQSIVQTETRASYATSFPRKLHGVAMA